jgi:thymidine phosphorylase
VIGDVLAGRQGFVARIATRELGLAVVQLGGGRRHPRDLIDHAVGLESLLGLGAAVEPDTPLARIHAASEDALAAATARVRAAYHLDDAPPPETPLIVERI